jgi:NAD(P)-dependent dehydrogenase (short-subunit alcohol dehydrogenase family)
VPEQLTGKVVLVIGGSSGIGRAAALLFAQQGATVAIAARNVDKGNRTAHEIVSGGGKAVFLPTDVSQTDQVAALVDEIVRLYGRLDCAFNNAAALGPMARTADYAVSDFDAEVSANLRSVWLCMKFEIQQMIAQNPGGGSIVNTSSVNGLGGTPGAALYSMAKAGLLALSKSAAQEYAAQGIRISALVAGAFDTDMLQCAVSQAVGGEPAKISAAFARYTAHIPLSRIGRPEEAAQAALCLLSDAASYVTGHSMIVDGGWTASTR